MGATYSVADGVIESLSVEDRDKYCIKDGAGRGGRWNKKGFSRRGSGGAEAFSKFMQKCNRIARSILCTAASGADSRDKRVWSASELTRSTEARSNPALPDDLHIGHFELGATVGTGSYATVCVARFKADQQLPSGAFALKVLHKTKVINERQVDHVKNERNILSTVRHPFIVGYFGCFQDNVNLYMLLEYLCGGELFTYIYKYGALGVSVARFYTAQAVLAIDFLHARGIVYRDLKPENMLLDMAGHLRLVDFGFAKRVQNKTYTVCGTHDYLAPEIFLRCGHGVEADWWSLGVLVYELVMGTPPFHADDPFTTYDLALDNKIRFSISTRFEVKDFIRKLLVVNPQKRLGSASHGEMYQHRFFSGVNWVKMLSKQVRPPIIPKASGSMDTCNYVSYPDVWQAYDIGITSAMQDKYFSDF